MNGFYLIKHWQTFRNGFLYKLTQEGCRIPAPAWTFGKTVFEEPGAGGCSLAQNIVENTCQKVRSGKITLEGHWDLVMESPRACCLCWLIFFSIDSMFPWVTLCSCAYLGIRNNIYLVISGIYLCIYLKPFSSPEDPATFQARGKEKRQMGLVYNSERN